MPASRILISNDGEGCSESLEVKFIQLSVAAYRRQSCSQKGYGAPRMTNPICSEEIKLPDYKNVRLKSLDCILATGNLGHPWAGEVSQNSTPTALKKI